jgi:hypothetical protein
MLWTIFVILVVLWLLGFSLHIAGSLIHLLLVVAAGGPRHQPRFRPARSLTAAVGPNLRGNEQFSVRLAGEVSLASLAFLRALGLANP